MSYLAISVEQLCSNNIYRWTDEMRCNIWVSGVCCYFLYLWKCTFPANCDARWAVILSKPAIYNLQWQLIIMRKIKLCKNTYVKCRAAGRLADGPSDNNRLADHGMLLSGHQRPGVYGILIWSRASRFGSCPGCSLYFASFTVCTTFLKSAELAASQWLDCTVRAHQASLYAISYK